MKEEIKKINIQDEIPEDLLIKVDEIRQGKFDNESLFNVEIPKFKLIAPFKNN
jgi:hypothetical protein